MWYMYISWYECFLFKTYLSYLCDSKQSKSLPQPQESWVGDCSDCAERPGARPASASIETALLRCFAASWRPVLALSHAQAPHRCNLQQERRLHIHWHSANLTRRSVAHHHILTHDWFIYIYIYTEVYNEASPYSSQTRIVLRNRFPKKNLPASETSR